MKEGKATHSSILAGESHGQRKLAGCSPWGYEESDTAEQLRTAHNKLVSNPSPITSLYFNKRKFTLLCVLLIQLTGRTDCLRHPCQASA